MKVVCLNTVLFFASVGICLDVIPERAVTKFVNEKYIENASFFVTRFGRNSPYYFNVILKNKHTWANNVTIDLVLYEYLHNEYRRSFVELHFRLCDMLNSDPYVGAMVAKTGIRCPVYPGMQHMENMTLLIDEFKYVMPFKKFMAQLEWNVVGGDNMAKVNFYCNFRDKKKHI